LRYIERDGVDKDGSKGVLYGANGPVQAETFDQPRRGEKHQFRIIISPEDARELDLTAYVRRLMAQVERDTGRRLEWAAVNHYDTEHPHAHLIVRGVDRDGRELRLDRAYISNGLRSRAQELATEELGPRLDVDVRRALAREVAQSRFTSLDREIERRAQDGRVEGRSRRHAGRIDESLLVARLEHLEALRLADRTGPAAWTLHPGWQDELRELVVRGDILKQIHRAVGGDRTRYRIVRAGCPLEEDPAKDGTVLLGRVASKGLSDELKGSFYAVLETPSGRAYHVPLDARSAEQLLPGDLVSFRTRRERPVHAVDQEIDKIAKAGGRTYHLDPTADGASHPHARRLRELERRGVATPESPGRWKISPNLLRELEESRGRAPRGHRLLIRKVRLSIEEQVRHPGPVTIDRLDASSLSPYGFGAELKRVLEKRQAVLSELRIRPDDPDRAGKLAELERHAAGHDFAVRTGQTFLPSAPDGFRGVVQAVGERFANHTIVSDGSRFVVLRAGPALRAAQGRAMVVQRDSQGRAIVRPALGKDVGS
jgi:type IV secretory pathway VirD2 relaxase